MKSKEEVIEEMQKVAEQMRLDDIEENPDILDEYFICDCCGKEQCLAGSIQYGNYRLCNDCVLPAATVSELKKLETTEDLSEKMEDKRLEEDCEYIRQEERKRNN